MKVRSEPIVFFFLHKVYNLIYSTKKCLVLIESVACDMNDVEAIRREFQSNGRNVDVANKENKFNGRKEISSLPYHKQTKRFKTEHPICVNIFFLNKHKYNYLFIFSYFFFLKQQQQQQLHCVFCENNHEPPAVYKSHSLRDANSGIVLCPVLRMYECPMCGATGDKAHTVRYCSRKPIVTMDQLEMKFMKKRKGYARRHLRMQQWKE